MTDVLRVSELFRIELTRNDNVLYNQRFDTANPDDETYTEHSADRLVLASNMTGAEEVNMGGVSTGQHLLVAAETAIKISLVTAITADMWTAKVLGFVGSFTHVYLFNDASTTVSVEVLITD